MQDDAQAPGLVLVKTNRARRPRATREKERRVKEQKEKGLLLHPPLSHKPTYTKQCPYHHHARLRNWLNHCDTKTYEVELEARVVVG